MRIAQTNSTAGLGRIAFDRVGGRTVPTRLWATSPLVLLSPRTRGTYAWTICGTLGGGLVAGDDIRLDIDLAEGAVALIATQASTKVYRSLTGAASLQQLTARVGNGAMLIALPDPVCCFKGAVYRQTQRVDLSPDASAVVLEWFTSGRCARGERWLMSRYESRTDLFVANRRVLCDATLLQQSDGPLDSPTRLGRFDCCATLALVGPAVENAAQQLLQWASAAPWPDDGQIVFSAAPLGGGALLRAAGPSAASLGAWLRRRLAFLQTLGVDDPWSRRN